MNLVKSTGTFGFFDNKQIAWLLEDIFIAIFLVLVCLQMYSLLHLEFQIHLEDYFLKELLMQLLCQVMLRNGKGKNNLIDLLIKFLIFYF